nr:hypothetical protein [Nitrosomonas nitrosa]
MEGTRVDLGPDAEQLSPFEAYVRFVALELRETDGAARFAVHHPAPEGVSEADLLAFAEGLTQQGWNASVAPWGEEGELLGVRITG